ncbi:olfactory receptor 14C36-like [Anas platyrhynchos]|uniref:olfactory receptor 14C36-like n=1 Tax=Anas platyrhynchos TaxID=8839 RepID=UPI003AF27685
MCRDGTRKAKPQTELNLARDVKKNKKGFYGYIGRRRQPKESVPPLINKVGELASSDMEKAESVGQGQSRISFQGLSEATIIEQFNVEFSIITIMSYNRYVAICKPLHYGTLLSSRACAQMAAAAWGSGVLYALLHTASTFSLPLCRGNAVDQFFCEIPQILKLSCSSLYHSETGLLTFSVFVFLGCFVFIVLSYVQIFRSVLRIPSVQGRHKAFSTCVPHLAVVCLFLSTGIFACLKPPSISSPSLNLSVAVLYSVLPQVLNPFIYSMRNQELKNCIRQVMSWIFFRMF